MNEELQVEVLNAAQVSMEKLKHPPGESCLKHVHSSI